MPSLILKNKTTGELAEWEASDLAILETRIPLERFCRAFPNKNGKPLSPKQIRRMEDNGELKVCRIGRKAWVMRSDIPGEKQF